MEFYCESCETAMCLECTEGEHREHVTVPLRDVLEQHKSALKNQLDAVRNRSAYIFNDVSRNTLRNAGLNCHFVSLCFTCQTTSADGCHRAGERDLQTADRKEKQGSD